MGIKRIYLCVASLALLSGCSTVDRMNCLIRSSTESIHTNREAVELSSEVIRRNKQTIESSTRSLEENRRHLEEAVRS